MTPGAAQRQEGHVHDWKLPEGPYLVISTFPEKYPYTCECGAFTHNPKTGAPCSICAPDDYDRRATRRVTLAGGPFDGVVIARPQHRTILLRADDPAKRAQKVVSYERVDDETFRFRWNEWTLPLVPLVSEEVPR